ncbi:MAG: hypothetical protein KC457_09035 [Myxococcales bacterium]|nr:hypothetical protein [Myxococcales bacterium]
MAGLEVPWSQQPTKDPAVAALLAASGWIPGRRVPATGENSWRADAWAFLSWLFDGTSDPDATAHVVETDGLGKASLLDLDVGDGVTGTLTVLGLLVAASALGTVEVSGPLLATKSVQLGSAPGDIITVLGTTTFAAGSPTAGTCTWGATTNVTASMSWIAGSALNGAPGITMQWNGPAEFNGTLRIPTVGGATGRIWRDGNDRPKYRIGAEDKFLHASSNGARRGYASSSTLGAPAASRSLQTVNAFAPATTTTIDVHGECWVARSVAGNVEVSLLDSVGGQIGTTGTYPVGTSATQVCFSRSFSADTTPRKYTLNINGLGQNVTVKNARVVAEVAENLG